MSQERLTGLMSINQEVSSKISFDDTINEICHQEVQTSHILMLCQL